MAAFHGKREPKAGMRETMAAFHGKRKPKTGMRETMAAFHGKVPAINTRYISPASFCDIGLGMAMFRDAHHYFAAVSKMVEAYGGIESKS